MTKDEALKAMENGEKITHICFSKDEWMKKGCLSDIEFEDGCWCSNEDFWVRRTGEGWQSGWSIYTD